MARVKFLKLGQVVRVKGQKGLFIVGGSKTPEKIKPLFKPVRYRVVTETEAEFVFPGEGPHAVRQIEQAAEYRMYDLEKFEWIPARMVTRARGPQAWARKLAHWWSELKLMFADDFA